MSDRLDTPVTDEDIMDSLVKVKIGLLAVLTNAYGWECHRAMAEIDRHELLNCFLCIPGNLTEKNIIEAGKLIYCRDLTQK